jgi:hypothetical protein|tara:strand:+ start:1531 stop:2325 length:795 start_codon:yes stop_codon:yes gene_type:complete
MQFPILLPNNKEIVIRTIVLKDLKYFSLLASTSLEQAIKFLESFIITKNLNVVEKLVALLTLREHCIDDAVSLTAEKGNIKMKTNYVINNIGDIQDIRESVSVNGANFTFNYPSQFNYGDSDSIFSIIESIEIGDEQIVICELNSEEYSQLLGSLPKELYNYIEDYVDRHMEQFVVRLWDSREQIGIEEMHLPILSQSLTSIISNLFNGNYKPAEYNQYIFRLCKRVPDPEFLNNSTLKELDQYATLYQQEVSQMSQDLKSQNK